MRHWLLLAVAGATLGLALSLVVWANREIWLPEEVPTHWNAVGEPDRFTPRDHLLPQLLIMPGVTVLMIGLAYLLPWLSPLKFKIEPFRPTYDYIISVLIILFTGLHVVLVLSFTQVIDDVPKWITIVSLLCLAAMGNVLGKVQRNFWIGVRTPWTLASETVWIRTHRLAAWLFVAGGLLGCALAILGIHPLIAMAAFGLCALFPVFYSLWLYKTLERQGRLGEP